jgi:LysM repeat protein
MRQQLLRIITVTLLSVGALGACGSSTKQAATTTEDGSIAIGSPTQSIGSTATQTAGATAGSALPALTQPPRTTIVVPSSVPQTYIVQAGDQLKRIAKKFGVDMTELMTVNSIVNADKIREGQKLIIPAATVPGATSPPVVPATTAAP